MSTFFEKWTHFIRAHVKNANAFDKAKALATLICLPFDMIVKKNNFSFFLVKKIVQKCFLKKHAVKHFFSVFGFLSCFFKPKNMLFKKCFFFFHAFFGAAYFWLDWNSSFFGSEKIMRFCMFFLKHVFYFFHACQHFFLFFIHYSKV